MSADGEELRPAEVGVLEVRSDQLTEPGWLATSDLAMIDEDGFVWIKGRTDGAINRGGFKVLPVEVAAVLERHPAVREAAVIGVADERLGQVPVAAVDLKHGSGPVDWSALREFVRGHLAPNETPVTVLALPSLPRHYPVPHR